MNFLLHHDLVICSFQQAIEKIKELAVSIEGKSLDEKRSLLAKCAATTLSSKLIGGEKEFFASMVVDSVLAIGNDDRLNMIGIKKVSITGSEFHNYLLRYQAKCDYCMDIGVYCTDHTSDNKWLMID